MITYAGVGLTPPADAQALVSGWWHRHRICEADHPAYLTSGIDHLPIPAPPAQEAPRVGVLHWPVGASQWATCHLLASGEQLAAVRAAIGSTPAVKTLSMNDGVNAAVETSLWLLSARPISQKGTGELYLLTLVDDRYWWWQEGAEDAPTAPATWADLFSGLFTSVGVTPTVDTVDADYSIPTASRWNVGYKPLPLLMDAAARTVGRRIVRALDGSVTVQSYTSAATADESNWTTYRYDVMAGGRLAIGDICRGLPASVSVVFPGIVPAVTTTTLASRSLTEYAGLTAVADRAAQVIADTPATAAGATRTAYANQATTDYYLWALSRTDCTIRGLVARPVTGLDECQEWVHGETPEEFCTRVIRPPLADQNQAGGLPGTFGDLASLASDFDITVDDAYQATGLSIDLPVAGTYLLIATVHSFAEASAVVEFDSFLQGLLRNDTAGTNLTPAVTLNTLTSTNFTRTDTRLIVRPITVTVASTIKLMAYRKTAGTTWTVSRIVTSYTQGGTTLQYIKLP